MSKSKSVGSVLVVGGGPAGIAAATAAARCGARVGDHGDLRGHDCRILHKMGIRVFFQRIEYDLQTALEGIGTEPLEKSEKSLEKLRERVSESRGSRRR